MQLRLSQRERFAQKLFEIKDNITSEDRQEAMKKLEIKTKATVSKYLNGKVQDLDTASKLLDFFQQRINERELVLGN